MLKIEHIVIAIAIVVVVVYLGGSSERGVIKLIERSALSKRKMPGAFSYAILHMVNSMTLGLMGLIMNVSLEDPFKGVPVVREGGKVSTSVFNPAPA